MRSASGTTKESSATEEEAPAEEVGAVAQRLASNQDAVRAAPSARSSSLIVKAACNNLNAVDFSPVPSKLFNAEQALLH